MITKTSKKLLLATITLVAATSLVLPSQVFANHGVGTEKWASSSVTYTCGSLSSLTTTSSVNTCNDIGTAASVWTNITNTPFSLTKVSSNGNINVRAFNFGSGSSTLGQMVNTYSGLTITAGDLRIGTNVSWRDATTDIFDLFKYDYISNIVHEFGHTVRLVHDENSSVMKSTHSWTEVYRTLSSHDIDSVRNKYP